MKFLLDYVPFVFFLSFIWLVGFAFGLYAGLQRVTSYLLDPYELRQYHESKLSNVKYDDFKVTVTRLREDAQAMQFRYSLVIFPLALLICGLASYVYFFRYRLELYRIQLLVAALFKRPPPVGPYVS